MTVADRPIIAPSVDRLRARVASRPRRWVNLSRVVAAVVLLAAFAGCMVMYTRHNAFPYEYHPDEGGKAGQILSEEGYRNFNHPQLLLEATQLVVDARSVPHDAQAVVETGRLVSATFAALAVVCLSVCGYLVAGLPGLLAVAPAVALCPFLLAHTHAMKEDAALVFGVAVTTLGSCLVWHWGRRPALGWIGVAVLAGGFALASSGKYVGVTTIVLAALALLFAPRTNLPVAMMRPIVFVSYALLLTLLINHRILRHWDSFDEGLEGEFEHGITQHNGLTMARPNGFAWDVTLEQTFPHAEVFAAIGLVIALLWWPGLVRGTRRLFSRFRNHSRSVPPAACPPVSAPTYFQERDERQDAKDAKRKNAKTETRTTENTENTERKQKNCFSASVSSVFSVVQFFPSWRFFSWRPWRLGVHPSDQTIRKSTGGQAACGTRFGSATTSGQRPHLGWDRCVWLFTGAFLYVLSMGVIPMDRYALPIVVLVALMAGVGAARLGQLIGRPWAVWGIPLAFAVATVAWQEGRCVDYVRQFADDSRQRLREFLLTEPMRGAVIVSELYAGLGAPPYDRVDDGLGRHVRTHVYFSAADTGSVDDLRRRGVTHVAVASPNYERYFNRHTMPTPGDEYGYDRRRAFYAQLFDREKLVWSREPAHPMKSYSNPTIKVYDIRRR